MMGCIRSALMEERALRSMNVPSEARLYLYETIRLSGMKYLGM